MKSTCIQNSVRGFISAVAILATLLFLNSAVYTQVPEFIWAKQAGGTDADYGYAIATDGSGNSIVTGWFDGTATFDTTTLTTAGWIDIFIAKYDLSGNLLWAKRAGGTDWEGGYDITTDGLGNSIVTGYFRGTANFDTVTLTSAGYEDIFIAKYNPLGNVLWAKQAGGADWDRGNNITTDQSGNIIVTGWFENTASFSTLALTSVGMKDIFIAKYDPSGDVLWAKQAGGWHVDKGYGIATDGSGNTILTGHFYDTASFDTITLTSAYGDDIFIAKYDSSGNVLWAKQAGGTDYDIGYDIATDRLGNIIVTGWFTGTATFDTITLISTGSDDIFIAMYDPSGNVLWAKQVGGTDIDLGYSIATDEPGNSIVTGIFEGTAIFGTTTLTSAGLGDIFIAKYDPSGNVLWAKRAGGTDQEAGHGIAIDGSGNSVITGYFTGTANFGPITLTSDGYYDIFIVKLVGWDITGHIGYYSNNDSVNDVIVKANSVYLDTSDVNGYYELLDLPADNYEVRPEKENDTGSAIGAFDAAWILQYGVGLRTFTPYQMIAADVSGNRSVSAFDAAKILQYGVGLINQFPVMIDSTHFWRFVPEDFPISLSNWTIAPDSIAYTPLNNDTTDNYYGIIYGDVSGNWHPSEANFAQLKKSSDRTVLIRLEHRLDKTNEKVIFSIVAEQCDDILAMNFTLNYNAHILKALSVRTAELTQDWQLAYNPKEGLMKVALAGSKAISKTGAIVYLEFDVLQPEEFVGTNLLNISEIVINEGILAVNVQMTDFASELSIPKEYALSQNYPNPFNPATIIDYQLPRDSNVYLKIFNLLGQQIRTLVDEQKEGGYHQVKWDGKDESGEEVASGVYLYSIEAGDFRMTKKMVKME